MYRVSRSVLRDTTSPCLRRLCSSKSPAIHETSLSTPLPGFEAVIQKRRRSAGDPGLGSSQIQMTRLSNGLRVASMPKFGQFCTVGACIDSGSRFEVPYLSGISHFVQNLAFTGSQKYADQETIGLK